MLNLVGDGQVDNAGLPATDGGSVLDEIVRDGARQMLAAAFQAEVAAYIDQFHTEVDANGRRLVVRNGCPASRKWQGKSGFEVGDQGVSQTEPWWTRSPLGRQLHQVRGRTRQCGRGRPLSRQLPDGSKQSCDRGVATPNPAKPPRDWRLFRAHFRAQSKAVRAHI